MEILKICLYFLSIETSQQCMVLLLGYFLQQNPIFVSSFVNKDQLDGRE